EPARVRHPRAEDGRPGRDQRGDPPPGRGAGGGGTRAAPRCRRGAERRGAARRAHGRGRRGGGARADGERARGVRASHLAAGRGGVHDRRPCRPRRARRDAPARAARPRRAPPPRRRRRRGPRPCGRRLHREDPLPPRPPDAHPAARGALRRRGARRRSGGARRAPTAAKPDGRRAHGQGSHVGVSVKTNQATQEQKAPETPEIALVGEGMEDLTAVLGDPEVPDVEDDDDEVVASEVAGDEAIDDRAGAVEDTLARTSDPVRMYLREMGTVSLLTREGEVEIAKRIEAGEQARLRAVLGTPYALARVLALAERLRAGEVRIEDLVRDEPEDPDGQEDGEDRKEDVRQRRRFLAQVARARRIAAERARLLARMGGGRRRLDAKAAARVARFAERQTDALCRLGLGHRHVDAIARALRTAAGRIDLLRTGLRAQEERY